MKEKSDTSSKLFLNMMPSRSTKLVLKKFGTEMLRQILQALLEVEIYRDKHKHV